MLNLIHGTDLIVISSKPFGSEELRTSKLMTEMALGKRVYFFAQPIVGMTKKANLYFTKEPNKVTVVQPYLPEDVSVFERQDALVKLMKEFIREQHIAHLTIWTDTPQGMPYIRRLNPDVAIYDKGHDVMRPSFLEQELLGRADLVLNADKTEENLRVDIRDLNSDLNEHKYLPDATEVVIAQKAHTHSDVLPDNRRVRNYVISLYQSQLA